MTFSPTSWPGSSGSGVGPSCVLLRETAVDVHAVGAYPLLWDGLVDDIWDQAILAALPTGLGLTASFDGSSAALTTITSGVWAFTLDVFSPDHADADVRGRVLSAYGGSPAPFGPVQAGGALASLSTIYALPSGAASQFVIVTEIAATANPYRITAQLCISRLA